MEWSYQFPNREQRNRFLSIIAMNVGEYGIGLGLNFEGLEHSLERNEANGRLISEIGGRAAGGWRLGSDDVTIELGQIPQGGRDMDRLRRTLAEQASNFGGQTSLG